MSPARPGGGRPVAASVVRGAAAWLSLAAAPTFALMTLLVGAPGAGGMAGMMCLPAHAPFGLGGMAPMYGLMSAFHLAPWLKLFSRASA